MMNNKIKFNLRPVLALGMMLSLICCKAQYPLSGMWSDKTFVSVKDFGAVGDGINDDTKSIQAAIKYAEGSGFSAPKLEGLYEENSIYIGASKVVYFPTGAYKISAPMEIGSYGHLVGEKCLVLPTKNKSNQINAFNANGWQLKIEGFQFVKFNKCIAINNNNIDVGKIVISDCDFYASNTAIELNAQSSITIIRENRFFDNKISLNILNGDKVDVSDNWITSCTMKGIQNAQIINNGVLHFDKNILVPKPPDSKAVEPAWINNYYSVSISNVRQGGEPGSFTLVNNFAEAKVNYPYIPNSVIIENSDCYGAYKGDDKVPITLLRLINVPNVISIKNIQGLLDTKLMGMSLKTSRNRKTKILTETNASYISISIENINGNRIMEKNTSDIPDELLKFKK